MRWLKLRFANWNVVEWRFTLHSFCVCFVCIVCIQSAKGFSALCSSCVLFITALSNIIILSVIKNNENTNNASLLCVTLRLKPTLLYCDTCLYFLYYTRFVLIKTWTFYIEWYCINNFTFGSNQGKQHMVNGPCALWLKRLLRGSEVTTQV